MGRKGTGHWEEAQTGVTTTELCYKHGMSDASYYKWREKYFGKRGGDVRKKTAD